MTAPKFTLSLLLLISMGLSSAWADEEPLPAEQDPDNSPPASNVEQWDEPIEENEWTWFGMGYESRRSTMGGEGASRAPAGVSRGSGGKK